jgi:uncharacterized membrane protein YgdD (TMEM256/DUF423 family)
MTRNFVLLGALFAFLGVAFGAFGAHALAATLQANGRVDTYETAVRYQMYHALALFLTAWLAEKWSGRYIRWAGWLFTAGIILFSGSLYILAILNVPLMGAVTPLGGAAFLAGWACLGWAAWKQT